MFNNIKHEIIGIRPGEKLHEQMIGVEDAAFTYEYDGYYKILPAINGWHNDPLRIKKGKKVDLDFVYNSFTNKEWMTNDELRLWIRNNLNTVEKI